MRTGTRSPRTRSRPSALSRLTSVRAAQVVMADPVLLAAAEDGKTYERSAVTAHLINSRFPAPPAHPHCHPAHRPGNLCPSASYPTG